MFQEKCPACEQKLSERMEALTLPVRIKNMTDRIPVADLYDTSLDKLRQLDKIITSIFKEN